MCNPIKIIYNAKIKLKSALHIGCGQKSPIGAFEIIRNGLGELVIPGTSISGVFFDTLKNVVTPTKDETTLWNKLFKSEDEEEYASPLIFRTVSLMQYNSNAMIRNRVKINRETKTAEQKQLFSYWEIEPENVDFDISITIDNLSLKNKKQSIESFTRWVETVLTSWEKEGAFFGGHSTSGNGFCRLEKATKTCISKENYRDYLDGNPLESIDVPLNHQAKKRYNTWEIVVSVDDEEDGYGTNALLIKGGVSHSSLADNPSTGIFVNTGKHLYIPGSSLKGTFSMYLEKYGYSKWLKEFFGQDGANHGNVYFPDLMVNVNHDDIRKHLINIERHAEDEFTRAVYGSGKFNEERLFHANAMGLIRIPCDIDARDLMNFISEGCNKRLISLGANGCYPNISIEEGDNEYR